MTETMNNPETKMSAADVVGFVDLCEQNDIEVYIDGGWGVDALLGKQTREHGDLDIALPHAYVPKLKELLGQSGYKDMQTEDQTESNFVMADDSGHRIDFHSYTFDKDGNNIFGVSYEPRHLTGTGVIAGHTVKCIPPEVMVEFHTGYELDEDDYHDVKHLCEKFDIPLPEVYRKFESS